jgi:hypothetical protein
MRSVIRSLAAIIFDGSLMAFAAAATLALSGCEREERVIEVQTPGTDIEVNRDKDTGGVRVEIERDKNK